MNLSSLVGARLKEIREEAQLSQAEMAIKVGVSREMWGRYERGALPGGDVLLALAQSGFDVTYILTGARLSDIQRSQLSVLSNTVAEMEPSRDGALSQSVLNAYAATGNQIKDREIEFKRLRNALSCQDDEEFSVVMDQALTLADRLRGLRVKQTVSVNKK